MSRYLLDTHALIGLITGKDEHLPKYIREDIESYCNLYYVSVASFVEMIDKQRKKTDVIVPGSPEEWKSLLEQWNIGIVELTYDIVSRFHREGIPDSQQLQHKDPFDRLIIATALTEKMTLVSADHKFPWWQRYRHLSLVYFGR